MFKDLTTSQLNKQCELSWKRTIKLINFPCSPGFTVVSMVSLPESLVVLAASFGHWTLKTIWQGDDDDDDDDDDNDV